LPMLRHKSAICRRRSALASGEQSGIENACLSPATRVER
jgi:hypothetical protein